MSIKRKWDFPTKGAGGKYLTKSLFLETNNYETDGVVFTLNDEETQGFPSLKQIYMSYDDPTEYQFAMEVFGSWKVWSLVSKQHTVKRYVDEWREEVEVRIRSEAVREIREQASEGHVPAAKYVAEKGWQKRKAGAPSKAEVERRTRVEAGIDSEVEKHYNGLRSVK